MNVAVVDSRGVDALCDTMPVGEYPFRDLLVFDALVADLGPVPVWDEDPSFEAWCGSAPWPSTTILDELLPTLVSAVADHRGMDAGQLIKQMSTQITVEAALKQQAATEFKPAKVPTGRRRKGAGK